ncbi:hypothetical protein BGZ83_000350 [Gryganskiella cystojenkinii]|nr:hypothetical protein BGZ83_000350 [Gryganskiella cystojenkinii]
MLPKQPLNSAHDSALPSQPQRQEHDQLVPVINGPPSNPLRVAEILMMIGHFLQLQTVLTCLRVCRFWHQILVHIPWRKVEYIHFRGTSCQPSLEDILKHGHFTKTLKLTLDLPIPSSLHCPNLRVFELDYPIDRIASEERWTLAKDRFSNVLRLHGSKLIHFGYNSVTTPRTLDIIEWGLPATVPSLSLWCLHCKSMSDWLKRRNSLILHRTTLALRGPWFEKRSSGLRLNDKDAFGPLVLSNSHRNLLQLQTTATKLSDLTLETVDKNDVMFECQFELVRNSPDLESAIGDQIRRMASEIQQLGFCPWKRLKTLSLPSVAYDDNDFKILIQALSPTLKDLHLDGSFFNSDSWKILYNATPLRTGLRSLSLKNCLEVHGSLAQTILSKLSGLERFGAEWIPVYEILGQGEYMEDTEVDDEGTAVAEGDRSWTCTELRELSVRVIFCPGADESGPETGMAVLEYLSRFTKLKVLNLALSTVTLEIVFQVIYEDEDEDMPEELEFTLDHGLDALRTLKKLRVLELPLRWERNNNKGLWSVREARWVRDNWPQLEKIIGRRPKDEEVYSMLKDLGYPSTAATL